MEPFVVSARKYRPQSFKDVVGQEAITNTLENAIEHDHLAQALLFCGPRGVGKTTCARILAKKINQDGTEGENEDFAFNIFELDAASNNSVDDIRNLIDQVRIPPQVGKYKVYIIDEVHMLSQSAFNAFLKTLEEPPKHAIFILATTEKHKIIPTILSRCQIFDFKRITVKDTAKYLQYIAKEQGVEADEDALHIIAQKADGAMRDALSIFDRVVSFSGKRLTRKAVSENLNVLDFETYFKTVELILKNDIPSLLVLFNKVIALGFDGHHFVTGLATHFRDLMVCKNEATIELLEVGEAVKKEYLDQAKETSKAFLLRALEIANDCDLKYKTSRNQRLLVELMLMQLASLTFEGEKKKDDAIIPASYFKGQKNGETSTYAPPPPTEKREIAESTSLPVHEVSAVKKSEEIISGEKIEPPVVPASEEMPEPPKITLENPQKRVSGLSLSSIKAKKEHQNTKETTIVDKNDLPKDPFTEADMQQHWADFTKKLIKKGRRILASSLQTDIPKLLNGHIIKIELPNHTMKKEVEREQKPLLDYLKEKLNNHSIQLQIAVNEEAIQKYAFTPEEKYQKLKEKNPTIELLRKEFDLDL
ncbi:DNA polymerase III subunit gamma/tau [Allomuricauda sp. SCSIO 65647]|uniref:DNA polymerase III subunit gamma/tau n=1 Tax=Allomuricauda sp. SCSIO 65647 TaxID=2908843 RepID=UPI001F17DB60|nr:DNA polymerase III subunit gamma/tau [Muricauda sp. SCSIO 65647]UJH66942.1 DNA polymerase III subunit gamma/tau [Muricauda sp. SCSIO 65647]